MAGQQRRSQDFLPYKAQLAMESVILKWYILNALLCVLIVIAQILVQAADLFMIWDRDVDIVPMDFSKKNFIQMIPLIMAK